jgi:hypothetical protein
MKVDDLPGLFGPGKLFSYRQVANRATTAPRDFERMIKKLREAEEMLARAGIQMSFTIEQKPTEDAEKNG